MLELRQFMRPFALSKPCRYCGVPVHSWGRTTYCVEHQGAKFRQAVLRRQRQ